MWRILVAATIFGVTGTACGQWQVQQSGVTASLRGVFSVGGGVAWASGSEGTVLRTVDGGKVWQKCAVPAGAEKLDFRGVQAFDAKTAIVMSSGPGAASRLYKTADGCATWTLLLQNKSPKGFWDALQFPHRDFGLYTEERSGVLAGDPVDSKWDLKVCTDEQTWFNDGDGPAMQSKEASFAASNSSLVVFGWRRFLLATGGGAQARVIVSRLLAADLGYKETRDVPVNVPMASGAPSAGIFSLAVADKSSFVAVGGDYLKPDETAGTAAFSVDSGKHWSAAAAMPHGYRSSVDYDVRTATFVAVGPNGTDVSADGGKTWRAVGPAPKDAADADKGWNAVSLPFVVGAKGRIGVMEAWVTGGLVQSLDAKGAEGAPR